MGKRPETCQSVSRSSSFWWLTIALSMYRSNISSTLVPSLTLNHSLLRVLSRFPNDQPHQTYHGVDTNHANSTDFGDIRSRPQVSPNRSACRCTTPHFWDWSIWCCTCWSVNTPCRQYAHEASRPSVERYSPCLWCSGPKFTR